MTAVKEISNEIPFGPPPIFSNITDELKEFIECPEKLPIHQLDSSQCYWPCKYDIKELLKHSLAPNGTTIRYARNPITGQIEDVRELQLPGVGQTCKNSMSMGRAPGPPSEGVRGNASNYLFWPGGFNEPEINENDLEIDIDFENNLKTTAKGFQNGVKFLSDNKTPKINDEQEEETNDFQKDPKENIVDLIDVINEEAEELHTTAQINLDDNVNKNEKKVILDIDESITTLSEKHELPVLKISHAKTMSKHVWAEELNLSIPINEFNKKVPDPALTFPYELDTFQKHAIIKLEENCNVFIAAHTSAGKTTVAEYAIALSQKHMTRAIYTSPIKALSNQKFRDFKDKFESVGLITGDIQINQSASCLIMTTEILQSMLYCASEVIRDLEYVIFDEVHYINNEDRGHVWEEIVILLPTTVTIVMLSATVPNPLEFANWVGKIKQKKMYVISTEKRPVPLEHYLYTGQNMKTRNDAFLVVDSNGQFLTEGYTAAAKKMDEVVKSYKKKFYPPKKKNSGPNLNHNKNQQTPPCNDNEKKKVSEKWTPLLTYLIAEDKLPVVVFSFSRNHINEIAQTLQKKLINHEEAQEVKLFFKSAIKRLNDSDANLPQVNLIRQLAMMGIGIHHSGILPILKEIVEMLFQRNLVKMLFATETFAMGVNMPARTVIFEKMTKFDGNEFRMLQPTEYIQMAGRAGRRGHDPMGTVIIFCQNKFFCEMELRKVMCYPPQKLQSRFKITYSMVLHLRRLSETISVKDMMRRSFAEAASQHNQKKCMFELEQVEKEITNMENQMQYNEKYLSLYDNMYKYLQLWQKLRPDMIKVLLKEEKIVIVSQKQNINKLGIVVGRSKNSYKIFVLKSEAPVSVQKETHSELWYNMIALVASEIYIPDMNFGINYDILNVTECDIIEVTRFQIKCDLKSILSDWESRKFFKYNSVAPNAASVSAINQLLDLSIQIFNNEIIIVSEKLPRIDAVKLDEYRQMSMLEKEISAFRNRDNDNFAKEFKPVFLYKEKLNEKERLRQNLSGETMEHYSEYKYRVEVLKILGYIDQDERVTLKGRVALEMGTHELLLTELVLKNILTDWDPSEIAALLSALVFQKSSRQNNQDKKVEPEKETSRLKMLEKIVQDEFNILDEIETRYYLPQLATINFELVDVVYRWAKQESFAAIMQHTDIQEGIIVRCIQQLNETLRDVRNAAIIIGNPILKTKMEQASTAIKRDIVFAASLYTQD